MEQLGLKNLALVSPQWVEASTQTMSLADQIMAYDRDIRTNTFGDGDPNFNDKVDDSLNPDHSVPLPNPGCLGIKPNHNINLSIFGPSPAASNNVPAGCGISGSMPNPLIPSYSSNNPFII